MEAATRVRREDGGATTQGTQERLLAVREHDQGAVLNSYVALTVRTPEA